MGIELSNLNIIPPFLTGKFNWQKAIKIALKDVGDDGISTKKLKKKVIFCTSFYL